MMTALTITITASFKERTMDIVYCRNNFFLRRKPWDLPAELILCIAAILGCISILLAYNKVQTTANQAIPSAILLIIPGNGQNHVKLSLPNAQMRPQK
jgi:hypothetical protein